MWSVNNEYDIKKMFHHPCINQIQEYINNQQNAL